MKAKQFREALATLGWTHEQAHEELGASSRQRIGDWARGDRPVPLYIAKHLLFRLAHHKLP